MNDYTPETPLKRCTKCGIEKPATLEYFYKRKAVICGLMAKCKVCVCQQAKEYRELNPEIIKTRKKKYYDEHSAEICAKVRAWKLENPERVKAWNDQYYPRYYQEHKGIYRERGRKWRFKNPAQVKAHDKKWRDANPEKIRVKVSRRRNAPGSHTPEDVKLQYKSQRGLCWWCGKSVGSKYHVDHWLPLARGGSNNPENLVISCPECNMSRQDRLPHEWSDRLL